MKRRYLFLLIGLLGCRDPEQSQLSQSGQVIATINALPITDEEMADIQKDPLLRLRFQSDQSQKILLEQVINYNVLYIEAMKRGYHKDLEVVFGLREVIAKKVRADILRKSDLKETVSDPEIQDYFQKNPGEFKEAEKGEIDPLKEPNLKRAIKKAIIKSREDRIVEKFVSDLRLKKPD